MDNGTEIILNQDTLVSEILNVEINTLEVQYDSNNIVSEVSDIENSTLEITHILPDVPTYEIRIDNETTIKTAEVVYERLSGSIDNINTIFTTSFPYRQGSIMVFLNGLKESYVSEIDSGTIELENPPSNIGFEDIVEAYYIKL